MNSSQRVVIVTGGGTGIGKGVARAFAADSRVVLIGRRADVLQGAARELGPLVTWQQADVSRHEDVEGAVRAVLGKHGRIDILINNAGFTRGITTTMPLGVL